MDMSQLMQEQHLAIKSNLAELIEAVQAFSDVFERNNAHRNGSSTNGKVANDKVANDKAAIDEAASQISQCQVRMIESVRQMQSAVYGPLNMVMLHFEECLRTSSFRTLLEMGVIDCLAADGRSMSATELAKKLQVDKLLLVRLMRVVTPTFFEEPSPEVYTHTSNSLIYLLPPIRANFKMMYDEVCLASMKMPEFLKKEGYQNPASHTNNPYTYAHDTKGLSMFDFLLKNPARFKNFNDGMKAKSAQTLQPYDIFPFMEELHKLDTSEETVLVIDVGGGNGQAAVAIRDLCRGVKGRIILQDQPQVLDGIVHPLQGVEMMPHDFFQPQPVKGALLYYIHRCLHDWPDNECKIMLQSIAGAMKSGTSRLLISEIMMPIGNTEIQIACSDICMMTFGGMERTEKQWMALLEGSGLKIAKVHTEQGSSNRCVLEVVLK